MEEQAKAVIPKEIADNQKIYSEHFNEDYTFNMLQEVFGQLTGTYYRAELVGFDELPARNDPDRPLIYASNHSGMAFPWDGMIFGSKMLEKTGWDFKNAVRPLVSPMLSKTKVMIPYLVDELWKRVGAIDATTLNFETMMYYQDSNLLIYPEGVPGIGKGFARKYQLQRVSTSFIRMALKYKTDIIPFSTVNGEYINPYSYSSSRIDRFVNKLGMPFLPLGPISLLFPFQPWVFYSGLPAKLTFVMGKRIEPYKLIDKPFEEITEDEIKAIRDKVNKQMQDELTEAVRVYGQSPYKIGEFLVRLFKNFKQMPYSLPFGWPLSFLEFERRYKEEKKKGPAAKKIKLDLGWGSSLRILFQNPFAFTFFIPLLGWIPIVIKSMAAKSKKTAK